MRLELKAPRILDFDIENRPLSYLAEDYTTGEVTAIAWSFCGRREIECATLTTRQGSLRRMLLAFHRAYDEADIVTGHYIRKHDLPVVNGAMLECGLPALGPKLTIDTKLDLLKAKYQSMSQEALCDTLGCPLPKIHMTQAEWRRANRLTAEGIERTRVRVLGDVRQHKWLRDKLTALRWLGPPRVWRP